MVKKSGSILPMAISHFRRKEGKPSVMRNIIKKLIQTLLKIIPLPLYSLFVRRDVIGLTYHAVSDSPLPHVHYIYPPVTTSRFEQALIFLKSKFNVVSYELLHACIFDGVSLPKRAVHLSFDDGYVECYSKVRPLLLKYGLPCTFFVTTDWIDNHDMFYRNKACLCIEEFKGFSADEAEKAISRLNHTFESQIKGREDFSQWLLSMVQADNEKIDSVCKILGFDWRRYLQKRPIYLSSEQIKEMAEEGFTIGSHTRTHPKLARVSVEEMEAEIKESCRIIQGITGAGIVPFAFPNTATGINRKTLEDIRSRYPYLGLLFDSKGVRKDVPFIINRIWAEKPEFSEKGTKTNIPYLLLDAYQELALENILALGRR